MADPHDRVDATTESLYRRVLSAPSPELVAALASRLAGSGTVRPKEPSNVDLASSGGPSSLSTILTPLMLAARGGRVPKLGVPGRPAGGVDVLESVSGYRSRLEQAEFDAVLEQCGYAHASTGGSWAPEDGALFRLRQAEGHQAVPALAVASLVAKKVAAGVAVAGLEARVAPHGNFGNTPSEARAAADLYCEVCARLGVTPVVILTDAGVPFQPHIGRGEAIVALDAALAGHPGPWLARHLALCEAMTRHVSTRVALPGSAPEAGAVETRDAEPDRAAPGPADLRRAHVANLRAQGSSQVAWDARAEEALSASSVEIDATTSGFVHYDLGAIRAFTVDLQSARCGKGGPGDRAPSAAGDVAGVRLLVDPQARVEAGEPVVAIRGATSTRSELARLFTVLPHPPAVDNIILEIVV